MTRTVEVNILGRFFYFLMRKYYNSLNERKVIVMTYTEYVEKTKTIEGRKELFSTDTYIVYSPNNSKIDNIFMLVFFISCSFCFVVQILM